MVKDGEDYPLFRPNIESQYSQASVLIQLAQDGGLEGLGDSSLHFQVGYNLNDVALYFLVECYFGH